MPKAEAGQDREFLRGIVTFDVEGRVGLRIAEPLRLTQAFVEGEPILLHAGEDVVAGAVEDAVNAGERRAVEAFAQRLDDRDAAGDGGLEIERHAVAFREHGKLLTVPRQQCLVCGHHRLAGRQRRFDGALGRIALPAHDLDQNIDRPVGRQRHGIGEPAKLLDVEIALLGARSGGERHHLDRPAAARHELVAPLIQETDHSAADGAQPGKPDFERLSHKRRQPEEDKATPD